ncbi:MAG: SGNH/GDSL hydrolase family protein [Thermoanaerobaculia bacterium]
MRRFERYVAIGDSTVEGLDDPDGQGGYRGWADRLADHIAAAQGGVLYANLGVRGQTTRQIVDGQLAPALALRPDLVVAVSGTNDLLRRRFDVARLRADIESMQTTLVRAGATVITFTLPDLSAIMPIARLLRARLFAMNQAIRDAAAASGAIVADMAAVPVASDPRLWSDDRLHANSAGHERIAAALAWHLGLPGTDRSWAEPILGEPPRGTAILIHAEAAWMRRHFVPWVWRHARGISSGDGITAKRAEMSSWTPRQ